jgi:hypothetical protein
MELGYTIQAISIDRMAMGAKVTRSIPITEGFLGYTQQSRGVPNLEKIPT